MTNRPTPMEEIYEEFRLLGEERARKMETGISETVYCNYVWIADSDYGKHHPDILHWLEGREYVTAYNAILDRVLVGFVDPNDALLFKLTWVGV